MGITWFSPSHRLSYVLKAPESGNMLSQLQTPPRPCHTSLYIFLSYLIINSLYTSLKECIVCMYGNITMKPLYATNICYNFLKSIKKKHKIAYIIPVF
jgi:hypothetical protein